MDKLKTEDQQVEPEMVIYPLRLEKVQYEALARIQKAEGPTRAWLIREAIRTYLERREAK